MKELAVAIAVGVLMATGLAAPVAARPVPVTIWIEYAFDIPTDGPNLPPKVFTSAVQMPSAASAEALCASESNLGKLAANTKKANLSLWQYLDGESARCVKDKSGNIKMAVGATPTGSK